MTIFQEYEEKPSGCSAVRITDENVDSVAKYLRNLDCEVDICRQRDREFLRIRWTEKQVPSYGAAPGELIVPFHHMLVYGRPMSCEDPHEFCRRWRKVNS